MSRYYEKNKQKIIASVKEYQAKNIEKTRLYKRKYKHKNKEKTRKFTNKVKLKYGCLDCGCKELCTLEFHHLKDKKYLISKMVSMGYTIKRIKEELRKCIVLCSNCHRKRHGLGLSWYGNKKAKYCLQYKLDSQCCKCKENNIFCLDFHHVNDDKISNIGEMLRNPKYKLQDVIDEINKCIVVCSNCHRMIHNDKQL